MARELRQHPGFDPVLERPVGGFRRRLGVIEPCRVKCSLSLLDMDQAGGLSASLI